MAGSGARIGKSGDLDSRCGARHAAAALAVMALAWPAPALAYQPISPPAGAMRFCDRYPDFCMPAEPVSLPGRSMAMLLRINHQVNDPRTGVKPQALITDAEKLAENRNWRVLEPGDQGACAEYVWTKYARLAQAGIPKGAMRPAEVRLRDGELHLVLLIRVEGVSRVLDNLDRQIWPARALRQYQWLAVRQADGFTWSAPDGAPA